MVQDLGLSNIVKLQNVSQMPIIQEVFVAKTLIFVCC